MSKKNSFCTQSSHDHSASVETWREVQRGTRGGRGRGRGRGGWDRGLSGEQVGNRIGIGLGKRQVGNRGGVVIGGGGRIFNLRMILRYAISLTLALNLC